MTRRELRGAAVLVAAVLVVAGCSDDAESAPATTAAVTTTTTAAPPPTSSTTTTTAAPPVETTASTIDPRVQADADVRALIQRDFEILTTCRAAMPNCDTSTFAETRIGIALDALVQRFAERNADGQATRGLDRVVRTIERVELSDDIASAVVVICTDDGAVRYRPGAGPGGADVIVDDGFSSRRDGTLVQRTADGAWRIVDDAEIADFEENFERSICAGVPA
jgi:hypothetical protein